MYLHDEKYYHIVMQVFCQRVEMFKCVFQIYECCTLPVVISVISRKYSDITPKWWALRACALITKCAKFSKV